LKKLKVEVPLRFSKVLKKLKVEIANRNFGSSGSNYPPAAVVII
jgi:hypothetical protein